MEKIYKNLCKIFRKKTAYIASSELAGFLAFSSTNLL